MNNEQFELSRNGLSRAFQLFKRTGVIGISIYCITTYIQWQLSSAPGQLTVTMRPPISVITQGVVSNSTYITIGGRPVKTAYQTMMHVENTGFKSICAAAFTDEFVPGKGSLRFTVFPRRLELLDVSVASMEPANRLPPNVQRIIQSSKTHGKLERDAAVVGAFSLNPKESIDILLTTSGRPENISVDGHISDCQIVNSPDNSRYFVLFQALWAWCQGLATLWSLAMFCLFCFALWQLHVCYAWIEHKLSWWLIYNGKVENEISDSTSAFAILRSKPKLNELFKKLNLKSNRDKKRLEEKLTDIVGKSLAPSKTTNLRVEKKNATESDNHVQDRNLEAEAGTMTASSGTDALTLSADVSTV